jgi:hypothetical protein
MEIGMQTELFDILPGGAAEKGRVLVSAVVAQPIRSITPAWTPPLPPACVPLPRASDTSSGSASLWRSRPA